MQSAKQRTDGYPTYVIKQIERTAPPARAQGNDWYRYVIEGARSQIVGYTHGTLQQVQENVRNYAAQMNARLEGRSVYPWTPRNSWKQGQSKI